MNVGAVFGSAILFAFAFFILKELGYKGLPLFSILTSLALLGTLSPVIASVRGTLKYLGSLTDVAESASAVLKILGMGYLSGMTADVCRDLGALSLERTVVFFGRVGILLVALPFFEKLIGYGTELIS